MKLNFKPLMTRTNNYQRSFLNASLVRLSPGYSNSDEKIIRTETDNQNGANKKEPGGNPTGSDHWIRSVNFTYTNLGC